MVLRPCQVSSQAMSGAWTHAPGACLHRQPAGWKEAARSRGRPAWWRPVNSPAGWLGTGECPLARDARAWLGASRQGYAARVLPAGGILPQSPPLRQAAAAGLGPVRAGRRVGPVYSSDRGTGTVRGTALAARTSDSPHTPPAIATLRQAPASYRPHLISLRLCGCVHDSRSITTHDRHPVPLRASSRLAVFVVPQPPARPPT